MRKPRLFQEMGVSNEYGLSNFLSNQSPLEEILVGDVVDERRDAFGSVLDDEVLRSVEERTDVGRGRESPDGFGFVEPDEHDVGPVGHVREEISRRRRRALDTSRTAPA